MRWLILPALLAAGPALAQTDIKAGAQTNFPPLADYPAMTCTRPGEPPKRPPTISAADVDRFNVIIGEYNKRAHDYVVCVNLYIRNADADMDLIRRQSRAASDEANR